MTPAWFQMIDVFGRIGLLSFGGPAAQIALMHDTLMVREKWLGEDEYLRALSLCMLLPGPEAMQLATYAGWKLRGVPGGLLAGALFVAPGALVIFVLAMSYIRFGDLPLVQAAFLGVKATVIVIVLQALLRLGTKTLKTREAWYLAGVAFLALFFLGLPFPFVVIGAGVYGYVTASGADKATSFTSKENTGRKIAIWGALWTAPLAILWAADQEFFLQLGLFYSKLAIVTFVGAYAVLAYMTQQVVQVYGWIATSQMIDALGLAETTPGPLILVTEFVAVLAGFAQGGLTAAVIAGVLALWVTFIPCFLWIFAAGPYLEQIAAGPRLSSALSAITAAVAGVILNLSIWFALHVFFAKVATLPGLAAPWPELSTVNIWAVNLTAFAAALMLWLRVGLLPSLGLLSLTACGLSLVGLA